MGPFIKDNNNTSKIMLHLLTALTPVILFSIYKNGYIPYKSSGNILTILNPLILIVTGCLTSYLTEFIYGLIAKRKHYTKGSFAIFPGLFLSLILPVNIPFYIVIIGAFIASFSKIIFGGFGKNIFNPALIGYIFIVAAFSTYFSTNYYLNSYELDTISKPTPLTNASISNLGYDQMVKPYGSLFDFFTGHIPGSLGETSALLCIVAFIYLTIRKAIKWRISVSYVTTFFIINYAIGCLLGQGIYYPLFQVLSGGLLFGAVFMATDPVTSAVTPIGQTLQGIFLAVLTTLLRFLKIEGVATSILIMNLFVFILDEVGSKSRFNLSKSILSFVMAWVSIIIVCFYVATSKRNVNVDPNFKIISKEKNNNEIVYVVAQKGYGGNIKAEVKISDDKVIKFKILSNHETKDRYQLVIDNDYLNKIINHQNNLDNLDTISSATVTSTALKKIIINVMEDYK